MSLKVGCKVPGISTLWRTPTSPRNFTSTSVVYTTSSTQTAQPKSFEEIPGPKGLAQLPIIGPAFLFKPFTSHLPTRPDLMAIDLHRKYGKIVRLRMPFGNSVLVSDPQDMQTVFMNEGKHPARPNFDIIDYYIKSRNLKTLSTMNGEEWRQLRMRVQPKFTRPAAPEPYIPAIGDVADDLVTIVRNMTEADDTDFRDLTFLYVLESLGQFCFSRRLGALSSDGSSSGNETVQRVKALFNILGNPPVLPLYKLWKTKTYRTVEENMDYLVGMSRYELKLALETIKSKKHENTKSPYFIETLMAGTDLTEEELTMAMSEFFFGGTDTTSKMLSLLLYHISRCPQQQQILYEEIKEIVGEEGPVDKRMLDKMNYTKACLKESFRLVFPLATGPPRFLPYDLVLAGYTVPKGTLAMLSNLVYLHDPHHIDSPQEFRPQRWLRGKDRQQNEPIPKVAFMPFGIGARMCLGKRFAELMMHLAVIKLVQNFELSLRTDPKDINIKYEIFPTTDKPLQIKFKPRHG